MQKSTGQPRLSIARTATMTGATLLVSTGAALGALYGYTVGSAHGGAILGGLLAAAALGGELLKPFAISAGIDALGAWRPVRAVVCLVLGAVCVTYSLSAELGLAAAARGDLAAERGNEAAKAQRAEARYQRLAGELAAIPSARPAGELQALIDGIDRLPGIVVGGQPCGGVANGPATREHCPRRAALAAELARAEQQERRGRDLRAAEIERSAAGAMVAADPLAGALAVYLAAVGWTTTPEKLAPWLALLPVLLLEFGSALGVVVVRAFEPVQVAPTAAAKDAIPVTGLQAAPEHGPAAEIGIMDVNQGMNQGADHAEPASRQDVAEAVLRLVRDAGGRVDHSERGLAKLIGTSRSTTRRALAGLVAAGALAVAVGANGTTIRLVG